VWAADGSRVLTEEEMKKMPEFTAEASLWSGGGAYITTHMTHAPTLAPVVLPQKTRISRLFYSKEHGICVGVEDEDAGQSYVVCTR